MRKMRERESSTMNRHAFPNRTTWGIVWGTITMIVLVWAMGALAILNVEGADAEPISASASERVRDLEAKVILLEGRNAELETRLDKMERERAERDAVLDDLIRRDAARRDKALED